MCYDKHAQTEDKENFRNYGRNNKELNSLIKEKLQKFVKNKKRRKIEKNSSTLKKFRFLKMKVKRASPAGQKV